ncbi:MAG: ABC transporter ATP-binding protein, partial [Candidatus Moranbacteria bacterium]|nr:ABC transporter ATP-binding protein [Candidatus Moranbacteria bacterium]
YNKGKDNAFQSLFDVSLNVKKGEFVVIFGPSGCGKSSLLNVLAGLEKPDSGAVVVDNQNILEMNEEEAVYFHCTKMGMIFQAYNLISTLNVLDNVALPQMLNNKRKKERDVKAMEYLERFGVSKQWKKIPTELSGGQQQRIGIVRAIINDPQIILADEPIGNLDTESANNVMEILGNLHRKEGKTIILVSHNPENIIWGTHIIYMKDGKITKEELRSAEEIKEVGEEKSGESDFDRMKDRFKGLSEEQIALMINPLKARMIVESFLFSYEKSQTDVMEKSIEMYLAKKIGEDQLLSNLDKDAEEGGAGLNYQVARKLINEVEKITQYVEMFAKADDLNKKSLIVLDYLSDKLEINIKDEERALNLANLIKSKLSGQIGYSQFKSLLDSSDPEKGVGLDRRIARKIAKEVDLFSIV